MKWYAGLCLFVTGVEAVRLVALLKSGPRISRSAQSDVARRRFAAAACAAAGAVFFAVSALLIVFGIGEEPQHAIGGAAILYAITRVALYYWRIVMRFIDLRKKR